MGNTVSDINSRTSLFQATTLDLAMNKPDVAIKIMKKYSDQFRDTVGLDLALLGDEIGIASETHSVFQEGRYWQTMVAAANANASAPSGTQDITIEVDSNNRYFPKEGNTIIYKGTGNIEGLIIAIDTSVASAPVVTVKAANGVTLPAVTEGDEIVINSSAWGEGSGQPRSSVKTYDRLDFYLQIIKDTFGITGSQLTNKGWVDISEYGTPFNFYNVGMADLDARQYRLEESALLLGSGDAYTVAGTPLTEDYASDTIQTTKGMMPWMRERGGVDTTVNASNWVVTDLNDIDDYLKTQGDISPVVLGYVGGEIARRISDQLGTLQGYGRDASNVLTQYIGGNGYDEAAARSRAVKMSFMEYANINRTYAFREIGSFSDSTGLGAANYNLNQYTMWFPLCNVRDGKTQAKLPLVSTMYKTLDGYNRRRELWSIQGAGGNTAQYNSTYDKKNLYMRSHIGLAFHAPNLSYITTAGE